MSMSDIGAGKRLRSPSDSDDDAVKTQRTEYAAARVEGLVDSLGKVHGSLLHTLVNKLEDSEGRQRELSEKGMQMEGMVLEAQCDRAEAQLKQACMYHDLQHHIHLVQAMQKHLHSLAATAASRISSNFASLFSAPMDSLSIQLDGERELNSRLTDQVQMCLRKALEVMQVNMQRALQAELAVLQRDVSVARLQAAYSFEQEKSTRHYAQVDALMRLIQLLSEKCRDVDANSTELRRAKEHVRQLENYLDLNGIVAAVQLPEFVGVTTVPPPPSDALQASTPHYFALRMLQHKDITLSELVHSWFDQEDRVIRAERKYEELKSAVTSLRHDALMVQERYLEEKQRREMTDRRLTEMVRERIHPGRDAAIAKQLGDLRWNYSKVVDDAAQLAVSLGVAKEELRVERAQNDDLRAKVDQLQKDADGDKVAQIIAELRRNYDDGLRSIQGSYIDLMTECGLVSKLAESSRLASVDASKALAEAREQRVSMVQQLQEISAGLRTEGGRSVPHDVEQQLELCQKRMTEEVSAMLGIVEGVKKQQRSAVEMEADQLKAFEQQLLDLTHVFETLSTKSSISQGSPPSVEVAEQRLSSVSEARRSCMMREVLADALKFVVTHLECTDAQCTSLLDASISDAQYVSMLLEQLKRVTAERSDLKEKLKESYDLIEQNHLTVVERSLMHEVSVEDSLDTAEAAERITMLQEQLAAQLDVQQRALEELRQASAEKEVLSTHVQELTREQRLLEEQVKRLTEALSANSERASTLSEKNVVLQRSVQAMAPHSKELSEGTEGDGGDRSVTNLDSLEDLMMQLGTQLSTISNTINDLQDRQALDKRGGAASSELADAGVPTQKELEDQVNRSGIGHIVVILRDTLQRADLLKHAIRDCSVSRTLDLLSTADETTITPAMELAAAKQANDTLRKSLGEMEVKQAQLEASLQAAHGSTSKTEENNQRLLTILKDVMEKQRSVLEENKLLKEQLQEVAKSKTDTASSAVEGVLVDSLTVEPDTVAKDPVHEVDPDLGDG